MFASGENDARSDSPDFFASEQEVHNRISSVSENFKYILPNGNIHKDYTGDKSKLESLFSPDIQSLTTSDYYFKSFTIQEIDNGQIPKIQLLDNTSWTIMDSDFYEYASQGESFSALGLKTNNVVYLRYNGQNPLFSANSAYNAMTYTDTNAIDQKVLDRFMFFRWQGTNMGIDLDTYMYAIDTFTGLVFTYVKIGAWKGAFGFEVPTRYDPIDIYTFLDGNPRLFFEYDPIGYVSKDGFIILHDWYIEKTKQKLQTQLESHLPTGRSPYYVP